jgi:hypothetical protein
MIGERKVVEDAQIKILLNLADICISTNDFPRAKEYLCRCHVLVSKYYGTCGPLSRAVVLHRAAISLNAVALMRRRQL